MSALVSYGVGKIFEVALETAAENYYRRRRADAEEELSEALRNARISLEDALERDETLAMLHRWDRAWKEGAVREKLRLLARALASEIGGGPEAADEFQQFADIVLSLSRDEIVFLATLYKLETAAALEVGSATTAHERAMQRMHNTLIGEGRLFANYDQFESVGYALGRTGLLIPRGLASGGYSFPMTLKLERLVTLTRLEEFAESYLSPHA